jgi:hypothetical protein
MDWTCKSDVWDNVLRILVGKSLRYRLEDRTILKWILQ